MASTKLIDEDRDGIDAIERDLRRRRFDEAIKELGEIFQMIDQLHMFFNWSSFTVSDAPEWFYPEGQVSILERLKEGRI